MFEEHNQDIHNETSENPPPQPNKKKMKKSKSLILKERSKYLPLLLLNYSMSEGNQKLEEMLSDLELFRKEYKEKQEKNLINSKEINSTNSTRFLIYNALEKNLIEISYIANKEIRADRINILYLWYKNRNKISEDLKRINAKTYKEIDEIDEEELLKDKENEEEKNEQNENEKVKKHKKILFKKINPRNDSLVNKKMLDDYQRKLLSKSLSENKFKVKTRNDKRIDQNEKLPEKTTESAILAKTISVIPSQDFWAGDYSTFYSYKNGTNLTTLRNMRNMDNGQNYMDQAKGGEHENNFFPKYNKETGLYFPPLNRETKFSYSYNRPQYNFDTMDIENKIKENKLKIISEKRSQEEIKEHLDKFGIKRAKYKEEMNNKYELKSVINMYVNSNEFTSPLLEKYKIKGNSTQKNKSIQNINNVNFYQTMNKPSTKFTIGVSSFTQKGEKKIFPKSNKNIDDFEKILDDNRIEIETISAKESEEENRSNGSKRVKKLARSESQKNFVNKKIFREINDKIRINSIKNIDINSKNILEQNKINKIKLKLKLPKEKIQTHLMNTFQKKSDKISSDVISKIISNNSLFKERKAFENMCNINLNTKLHEKSSTDNKSLYSISREEDDDSGYHNFCISMYDQGNLKKIVEHHSNANKYYGYNNLNKNNIKDSKIQFNKLHRTFHLFKDNLLNLRRTMSDWKANEYLNLVNEIKKNNKKGIKERDRDRDREMFRNNSFGIKNIKIKKQNSLLNAMINPNDEFGYSRYFLPRTGSMLLSRIEESKTKKKK